MLKAIEEKLANLKKRSLEINDLLIQQDIASDVQKFTKLNKELSDILPIVDRKSTRLNSSHSQQSRMPSSA